MYVNLYGSLLVQAKTIVTNVVYFSRRFASIYIDSNTYLETML